MVELKTSVKRHWANNFSDEKRQNIINLFLGIIQPTDKKNTIPIRNMQTDTALLKSTEENLPRLSDKWWEVYLRKFEMNLPQELRKDLNPIFSG